MAKLIPSFVILKIHACQTTSPGVRKRLKQTVMSSRNRTVFIPLTIYRKGTWERRIIANRNSAASRYPAKELTTNSEIR